MEVVYKRFLIALDIKQSTSNRDFEAVESDNGNILDVTLTDDGQPVDLTGCFLLAVFSKSDGKIASQDNNGNGITLDLEQTNKIVIDLYPTSFAPGLAECELQVYSGENNRTLVTSAKFNFLCRRAIVNSDTITQTDEWPIQDAYIHGAKVVHNNKKWANMMDANIWAPGVYGWEEVIA